MAQITIPDETFNRLAQQAAAGNRTVEQYLAAVIDSLAPPPPGPCPEDRMKALDDFERLVQSLAHRFPPAGHVVNYDRDGIYREREDAQL